MTNLSRLSMLAAMAAPLLLSACASGGGRTTTTLYDFGPLPQTTAAATPAPLPALIVADVDGPPALDSERMQYRLLYADARQARPYAYNQWTSTPPQLLTQRVKARLAQAGVKVLTSTDVGSGAPMLRLELDDFAQNFTSATQSSGALAVRASLFRNHRLVDQRTFQRSSPAPSADAAGGAHALADASDALAADLLAWLATLPPQ
ncbi:MAG TPA: ABC-type transport auxiliary lipoprotein family protein [Burkholderiaceae bacterium]|nr:ABC-type transport auxiliary lipoprotein family protein [Burkholderiaceae bacterium]